MGLTVTASQTALDAVFTNTDFFMWSVNGTSETANVPRVSVGTWAAATAADPSVKTHTGTVVTGAATGTAVVSHWAVISAAASGTQKTDWEPFTGNATKSLGVGDKLEAAAGSLQVRGT